MWIPIRAIICQLWEGSSQRTTGLAFLALCTVSGTFALHTSLNIISLLDTAHSFMSPERSSDKSNWSVNIQASVGPEGKYCYTIREYFNIQHQPSQSTECLAAACVIGLVQSWGLPSGLAATSQVVIIPSFCHPS